MVGIHTGGGQMWGPEELAVVAAVVGGPGGGGSHCVMLHQLISLK